MRVILLACACALMVIGSAGSAHAQNFQFWPPQNFEGPRAGLPKCQAGDMTVVRTDLNPSGVYCQKPAAGLPVCPANQVLVSDGTKFNCQPTTTIAPPAGQSCAATVRSCCGTAIPISPLQHLQIYSGQHNNNGTGPGGLLSYGSPMVYCVYQCVNGVVLSQSDGFSCRFEQTPPDRDGNY